MSLELLAIMLNIVFFTFLFYFSWFYPEKVRRIFIDLFSTWNFYNRIESIFGNLEESMSFIPYIRICATFGVPFFIWLLFDTLSIK